MKNQDIQKINDFIAHLLSLPNIKNEPPLIGEGLILNFIVQNMSQLQATFKTDQFFPNLEWNDVLQVLLSKLYERIANDTLPIFESFIKKTDFDSLNKVYDGATLPNEFHKEKLLQFIHTIFKNKDVRYNMSSALNMFQFDIIEKYLTEIFNRRDSLYNELVRVQKTYLECDEYIIFMKILLIIKNASFMKIPINPNSSGINIIDALKMPGKGKKYIGSAITHFKTFLPNVSNRTIELAIKANLKEEFTGTEDTSSRFLFILSHRFHKYKPITQIDRGAESPDKSWFAIARKNATHYGYDKRLLEGLYRIAGDNSW